MQSRFRHDTLVGKQEGYALVAALLILLLMTAFGIWAMLTSTSESRISGNMNEEQMMFFYAEQGVDRILSHLHYLDGGIFSRIKGLGYPYEGSSLTLNPVKVLNDKNALWLGGGATANPAGNVLFKISAWINPKDYENDLDRRISRPLQITTKLTNNVTNYTKTFFAEVQPKSIWDFAYFSMNHNPAQRDAGAICGGSSNTWYNCHTVFHGPSTVTVDDQPNPILRQPDTIIGDMYLRNAASVPDDTKFYVRNNPLINGQVRYRNVEHFDLGTYGGSGGSYSNSTNQTLGGSSTKKQPEVVMGVQNMAKEIDMFDLDVLTNWDTSGYRRNADIRIGPPGAGYIWKIIFRNDLDTDNTPDSGSSWTDDCREEGRVASAITTSLNDGQINCPNDRGVFLLYKVPWSTSEDKFCALYGDTMKRRHEEITNAGRVVCKATTANAELWSPTATFANDIKGDRCFDTRTNISSGSTFGEYDENDIQGSYNFFMVPSQGETAHSRCLGSSSGTYNGIINVEGDVMISGIVDGRVTVVVNGDIYMDHELEKEDYNKEAACDPDTGNCTYNSVNEIDMVGLFATGDIIIPEFRPYDYGFSQQRILGDDWSDAHDGRVSQIGPSARLDSVRIVDDMGDEDIHAVMVSFGYGPCTGTAGGLVCNTPPTDAEIRNFQVGLWAWPRTDTQLPNGTPCCMESGNLVWKDQANDSGTLRIIGALIQNYSGRVGYDYDNGGSSVANSTCTGSSDNENCNFIGHRLELIYDNHLKFVSPAMPVGTSSNRMLPYGNAAYEIVSWRETAEDVNGDSNGNY